MINYIFFNSYTICLYINELLLDGTIYKNEI